MDEVRRLFPLAGRERLGGLHDVIPRVLRWTGKDLSFVVFQHASISLADDALLDVRRGASLSEEGYFEEHRAGQIHALEQLEIDVHVKRQLSLTFQPLLFR